jgi:hypothetical protein
MIFEELKKNQWKLQMWFDFYGIRIGFQTDVTDSNSKIASLFPFGTVETDKGAVQGAFLLITNQDSVQNGFYWVENGKVELLFDFFEFEEYFWKIVEMKLVFVLAMISPPKMFFFHAGAVALNGKGIVIPGKSFAGKTTLTKEFIKHGAIYYSDDCALINSEGLLFPYPISLAVRGENGREYVESKVFGSVDGVEPVKVEYVLFASYKEGKSWSPTILDSGHMTLRLLEHLFFPASINQKPKEILELAAKLMGQVKIIEGVRGEAIEVVKWFTDKIE